MIRKLTGFLIFASAICTSCASHSEANNPVVTWEILSPEDGNESKSICRLTVTGLDSISRLCFNQLPREKVVISQGDSLFEICAGYYFLTAPEFGTSAENAVIEIRYDEPIRTDAFLPESFHAITPGGKIIPVETNIKSLLDASKENKEWTAWITPADSIYRLNEKLISGKKPGPFDIAPSFKKVTLTDGSFKSGTPIKTSVIRHENPEFYRITLTPDNALIEGASPRAIKMAQRTLERRLLEPNGGEIPCAIIEDYPDYPYRALMIDIARNFYNPEQMRKITALMADYRLNTLHFHITDDEAWRLEIPGLPELTEVGSRRGYTFDSKDFLPGVFNSDGNPDSKAGTANGFFSRKEFISFLQYCDSLGISVIPEVESPGHARAAVKAMEAYERRTGDGTYRMTEPGDKSVYTTAQDYHDNLMNPAMPGTYAFIAKVVDEIEAMYHEAGVNLPGIHLGGDEVPEGAWDGSPAAIKMAAEKGLNGRHGLQGEFVKKIARIMRDRSIPMLGWQDIYTGYDDEYHPQVAPQVGGVNCWVSPADPEKNNAIKGVKAGYPVILSNVDYFYMDMLYGPHPEERGLYWGGFVDELKALSGYPDLLCPDQAGAKGEIIGVSGQLWGETLRSLEGAEILLFPKSIALAERGWNGKPTYSPEDFSIMIGEKELPRLKRLGVTAHMRAPGIKIEDGKIFMNAPYPDAEIHYTLDGTKPTPESPVYTSPIPVEKCSADVRAIITKDGYQSVTTLSEK